MVLERTIEVGLSVVLGTGIHLLTALAVPSTGEMSTVRRLIVFWAPTVIDGYNFPKVKVSGMQNDSSEILMKESLIDNRKS